MPILTRVMISFCIGAATILAWKSYGDVATRLLASSYPQLGWLAPRTAPIVHSAPDQQRFDVVSVDLNAMRQTEDRIAITQEQITRDIDQLTATQERMTRNVGQLTGSQEQMMREIIKLQPIEPPNRQRNAEAQPRPARKPIP